MNNPQYAIFKDELLKLLNALNEGKNPEEVMEIEIGDLLNIQAHDLKPLLVSTGVGSLHDIVMVWGDDDVDFLDTSYIPAVKNVQFYRDCESEHCYIGYIYIVEFEFGGKAFYIEPEEDGLIALCMSPTTLEQLKNF